MNASAPQEVRVPYPPRFWWLKRLSWAGVGLIVLVVVSRVWWGWVAERNLRAALAPATARGEPLPPEALNPPDVVDQANAAWYLKGAGNFIDPLAESPTASGTSDWSAPPYGSAWEFAAAADVAKHARAFPLARQARAFERFDWGTRIGRPMVSTLLRHLNHTRPIALALTDAALYSHLRGDDVAALELLRDVRHEVMGVRSEPFLVCNLVGIGIETVAVRRLMAIAPGLRVAPGDGPAPAAPTPGQAAGALPTTRPLAEPVPVTPAHVKAFIAELLDEIRDEQAIRRAYQGERAMHVETADFLSSGARWLRPMFRLDAARLARADDDLDKAAAARTWPTSAVFVARSTKRLAGSDPRGSPFGFIGGPAPPSRPPPPSYARAVSSSFAGGQPERALQRMFRLRSERRMAAVSLAAQLYRADRGAWPPSLEAMVPTYLPAVPGDAMAADGGPLRYVLLRAALPDGGDRPVVYSAGDNGTWEGIEPSRLLRIPNYGWMGTADEWRDLARWDVSNTGKQAPSNPTLNESPGDADVSPEGS